jgi:hypothetical protein
MALPELLMLLMAAKNSLSSGLLAGIVTHSIYQYACDKGGMAVPVPLMLLMAAI